MINQENRIKAYRPIGGGNYHSINALRFPLALMVVQIHTASLIKPIMIPIIEIAVPVFFMISGFFLINEDGHLDSSKVKKQIKKIGWMVFVLNLFYLVLFIGNGIMHGTIENRFIELRFWFHLILLGDNLFQPLWYLTAYLGALIVIYFSIKFHFQKLLPYALVLIPLSLLTGKYSQFILGTTFPYWINRNFLSTALPLVVMGCAIKKFEMQLPKLKATILLLSIVMIGLYSEYYMFRNYDDITTGNIRFFTIPLAALVFILTIELRYIIKFPVLLCQWGRKYSLDIYLWHIPVKTVVGTFVMSSTYLLFETFVVSIITILIATMLNSFKISRLYTQPISLPNCRFR